MKTKNSTRCSVCSHPDVIFWVSIPDIYEQRYLYPLPEAKFCPVCGKLLKKNDGDKKHGSAAA